MLEHGSDPPPIEVPNALPQDLLCFRNGLKSFARAFGRVTNRKPFGHPKLTASAQSISFAGTLPITLHAVWKYINL